MAHAWPKDNSFIYYIYMPLETTLQISMNDSPLVAVKIEKMGVREKSFMGKCI